MNIFFLHRHPRRCARWHCDKHVVKMLVETCQLLYTCHWMVDGTPNLHTAPYRVGTDTRGYKKTHWNHPCSKWVSQSLANYRWLTKLGSELLREYAHRFPSKRTRPRMHASSRVAVRQPSSWVTGCGLDSTADVHTRPIQDGRRRIVVSTLLHRRKESVAPLHGSARPALGNTETHVGKQSVNDRARS